MEDWVVIVIMYSVLFGSIELVKHVCSSIDRKKRKKYLGLAICGGLPITTDIDKPVLYRVTKDSLINAEKKLFILQRESDWGKRYFEFSEDDAKRICKIIDTTDWEQVSYVEIVRTGKNSGVLKYIEPPSHNFVRTEVIEI